MTTSLASTHGASQFVPFRTTPRSRIDAHGFNRNLFFGEPDSDGPGPQAYVNDMARQFKEVWAALDISFDDFIQTSEPRHHEGCRKFIQRVYDNGYIYKGSYEGIYCEGCEAFKLEKELVDGKCPLHPAQTPVKRSEPCYYFKQSVFQDQLLAHYEAHPDFVLPETKRNEALGFIRSGLQDFSISRTSLSWGIPLPWDPHHTTYVWFDALTNYITAAGYASDDDELRRWWPGRPGRCWWRATLTCRSRA